MQAMSGTVSVLQRRLKFALASVQEQTSAQVSLLMLTLSKVWFSLTANFVGKKKKKNNIESYRDRPN